MIQPVLQPQQPPKRTILTVSQLNRQAKSALESGLGSIWLSGEISNFTKAASGHWYFTMKDDSAQIRCAMFRFKTQNLRFSPKEGDKVIVKGKVSLYEARGDYQLIADFMEPAGLGDLQQKLNELMIKLKSQGLFAAEHKQVLPSLPTRIGVVTSATGAAIHDVLTVLERRCPMVPVVIYPSQVQGARATDDIVKAIDKAESRAECDVLLITRGGGSLEDLWCFNDEKLAHKIFNCSIPTIAAIGHEVDTTVAELVADLRAPTPSAAAELLVPEQQALQQKVDFLSIAMADTLKGQIEALQTRLNFARLKLSDPANAISASQYKLEKLQHRLSLAANLKLERRTHSLNQLSRRLDRTNPVTQLKNKQQQVSELKSRLNGAWQKSFAMLEQRLKVSAGSLDTLSPLSTLSRGYSIAKDPVSGKVINQKAHLKKDQIFSLILTDGEAECQVKKIRTKSDKPV